MKQNRTEEEVRQEVFKEVLSAIRYGDLKKPIGDQMLKPFQTVGGFMVTFEEWFQERFKDEL